MLVNLWASWCRPCLAELKEFAEREADLHAAGVRVLPLSVDRLDTERAVPHSLAGQLLKKVGYSGRAGWATAALVEKLGLAEQHLFDLHQPMSVPTSLLINSSGQLVVLYRGPVSVDQLLLDVNQLPDIASSATGIPFAGRWRTSRQRLSPIDIAWKLVDEGYLDDSMAYILSNRELLDQSPLLPRLFLLVGNHLLGRDEAAKAVLFYREALKINANFIKGNNNLAWVLATHPDESIRNGKEALRHITVAVDASPPNAFALLDTLAAAYAEDAQFDQAIATAKRAIEIAISESQFEYVKSIRGRLQLYQAGRAYRDK